jgi:hypothetical protein
MNKNSVRWAQIEAARSARRIDDVALMLAIAGLILWSTMA